MKLIYYLIHNYWCFRNSNLLTQANILLMIYLLRKVKRMAKLNQINFKIFYYGTILATKKTDQGPLFSSVDKELGNENKNGEIFPKKLLIYQSLLSEWHFSIIGLEQLGRDGLQGEIRFCRALHSSLFRNNFCIKTKLIFHTKHWIYVK